MARYSCELNRVPSSTTTIGSWTSSATTRRLKFYHVHVGCEGTAADVAYLFQAGRITAAGTSTAVVPEPLDPADAAALSVAGENHSAEPTYTAGNKALLSIGMNTRSTVMWTARPGCEIITPATNANGLGFRTPTINGTAMATTVTVHAEEQ